MLKQLYVCLCATPYYILFYNLQYVKCQHKHKKLIKLKVFNSMSTSYQCCTITMNYHYYLLSTAIVFYIISILLEVYHSLLCYLMLQQLIAGQFRVFHPVNVNMMKESTFVSGKYSTQNLTHVESLMILTMYCRLHSLFLWSTTTACG